MDLDLDSLTLKELRDLRTKTDKAISSYDDRRKRDVVSKIEEIAREHGFALNDLAESLSARKKGTVAAKYVNPVDPAQTWTGRGRKPRWVSEAIDTGKSLEDLAI